MKKLILILTLTVIILTLSSCIKIYMPEGEEKNTQSDTEINLPDDQADTKTGITFTQKSQIKDIYQMCDLGNYYGNGFDNSSSVVTVGVAQYEILQDFDEASRDTDYGMQLDKEFFNENYIVVVKFLYERDKAGIIGFKNFLMGTGGNYVTVLNNGSSAVPQNQYFYVAVPQSEMQEWYGAGTLEIRKQSTPYQRTSQIVVDNDFVDKDGTVRVMSRSELKEYLVTNNLPISIASVRVAPHYLLCYSKRRFDTVLSFTAPEINGDTINWVRDYNVSSDKAEKALIDILPLEMESIDEIRKIELTSEIIDYGFSNLMGYQIDNTLVDYNTKSIYKTFNGGVYYGTELAELAASSYTVIENYRELLDKAEFYIDEEIFNDNYVLVLKLVGVSSQRLGFSNASVVWSDTIDGQGICSLQMELHLTPYYNQILNDSKEDLWEELEPIYKNRVEYEYVVVPKASLKNIRKTGKLDLILHNEFKDNYYYSNVSKTKFNDEDYSIESGNTWRIRNKLELDDFNKKFGTNFKVSYLGPNYNKEYVIIYLKNVDDYKIYQTVIKETDTVYEIKYLAKKSENPTHTRNEGHFYCLSRDIDTSNKKIHISYTVISNVGEYESHSVEKEIEAYDFYPMELYYNNKPDWKYKVITDYNQLQETFNTYKHYEIDENVTVESVFPQSTFDNNYIVAVYITEGGSGMVKNTFYNARIGGNGVLYLYAFENSAMSNDALYDYLYFISIPKEKLSSEIQGVRVELTTEVVYNGPFENVIVTSNKQENVKLENGYAIINSYGDLESVYANYASHKKLQNIDFENNFVIAFNRHAYRTAEYYYGDFVNFKTTRYGTASITFMADNEEWIINDLYYTYTLDFVIIPREYVQYEINYFYVRYATYGEEIDTYDDRLEEYPEEILYEQYEDIA